MKDFKDIPEEKFENMDKAIQKSVQKDIKNLKINYIDIQNFKNIEYISTELFDWNIIWGWNWNGKSSFLEAILTAIKWHKFYWTGAISPSSLVQNWENKATVKLMIKWEETEIIVERIFIKGTTKKPAWDHKLKAEINWKKISQTSLDELLNTLTLDPLALWKLTKTEQIKEIKNTIWLDTTEIDKKILDQEETTKESRALKTQSLNVYEKHTTPSVPDKVEEVKLETLFEAKNEYMNIWTLVNDKDRVLDQYKAKKLEITEIEKKLEQAKIDLQWFMDEWQKLENKIEETEEALNEKHWSNKEIDEKIADAESINEKAGKYKKYLEVKKERDESLDDFKKDEEKLDGLRSDRTKMIADSNIPEYMKISEDYGILVDEVEYKLLNTARKIEVAIDLVLISGSPLRMIRIEQGGELDTRTLEAIKPKIIEHGFQIFIERPVIDKYDSIIISDGEIVEDKEDFINNQ